MDAEAQAALRRAGLDVGTIQRDESDTFRFFKAGAAAPFMCMHDPPLFKWLGWHGEADLETNRTALVDGLLACVGEAGGDCRFDTKIAGLRATAAGAVELLAEGDEVLGEFDVVVDATGTHSPLRRYRFASRPRYTGVTWIQGVVDSPEASLSPEIVRQLGQGTLGVCGPTVDGAGTTMLSLQRFGADPEDKRAVCILRCSSRSVDTTTDPRAMAKALDLPPGAHGLLTDPALLAKVRALFRAELAHPDWPEDHRSVADSFCGFRVLPIFMMPGAAGAEPVPEDGLALLNIGDALHALPPWSGTSGNFALRDASDAATALLELARAGGPRDAAAVVATLRRLEGDFLRRADGVAKGGLEVRTRCERVAKAMTELWPRTPIAAFDPSTFFTGGRRWSTSASPWCRGKW